MAQYSISCTLGAFVSSTVEFPEGKTWDDVKDWYVKWDTLHVTFTDDDKWVEFPLNSDSMEAIDWKRPRSVEVNPVDEESGETDYYTDVASQ